MEGRGFGLGARCLSWRDPRWKRGWSGMRKGLPFSRVRFLFGKYSSGDLSKLLLLDPKVFVIRDAEET